jgi:transposase InsO family protein
MNSIYKSLGISKQAFHKMLNKKLKVLSEQKQLLVMIYQIREDHPTMGARDMYYKLRPLSMGRDRFEAFCKSEGLTVTKVKNWRRTTDSTGVVRFDNLLKGMILTGINQAWQSDITYYEINGRFYYITFIEDSFSRRILGYSVAKRLTTEQTTLPALQMAIKLRTKENTMIAGVVFHSDGGGQYYDKAFLKLTQKEGFKNSMCEYPWDNGKVERLNGVIKNNYLVHRDINSFEELKKEVDRTVLLYNQEKPHIELQRKSPNEFEKIIFVTDNNPSCSNIIRESTTQKMKISS